MVGNVLLLKHAESVPQCALAMEDLFHRAGAPRGVLTNLFASIEQVARVIDDDRVRGVTLTGSERAGASVAERAGRNLKRCVMELGGSDPLIVLEDAPLEASLNGALAGRMFNAGQCCVGTKRIIIVGRQRGQEFLAAYTERMAAMRAGDPSDPQTTLGPLASERGLNLLLEQIARGTRAGAVVATGGRRMDRPGFFMEPTVLSGIDSDNPLYKEELFGPVAQLYIVEDEDEAIALANGTPYGLGGSVFTADIARGQRLAAQIDSGMFFINQPFRTSAELPFGGVKNSGFGRELSQLGFDEFVNKRVITVAPAGTPPFGPVPSK